MTTKLTMAMAPSGIAYRGFKIQECGGRARMLAQTCRGDSADPLR